MACFSAGSRAGRADGRDDRAGVLGDECVSIRDDEGMGSGPDSSLGRYVFPLPFHQLVETAR
jgi:hypothetical protein